MSNEILYKLLKENEVFWIQIKINPSGKQKDMKTPTKGTKEKIRKGIGRNDERKQKENVCEAAACTRLGFN